MFVVFCFILKQSVAKGDEKDGIASSPPVDIPSHRVASPVVSSNTPDSDLASPPSSPVETWTPSSPRQTSQIQREVSHANRPVSPQEKSLSPPHEESSKRSATFSEVEDSLAELDAIADDLGQELSSGKEDKTEVNC